MTKTWKRKKYSTIPLTPGNHGNEILNTCPYEFVSCQILLLLVVHLLVAITPRNCAGGWPRWTEDGSETEDGVEYDTAEEHVEDDEWDQMPAKKKKRVRKPGRKKVICMSVSCVGRLALFRVLSRFESYSICVCVYIYMLEVRARLRHENTWVQCVKSCSEHRAPTTIVTETEQSDTELDTHLFLNGDQNRTVRFK